MSSLRSSLQQATQLWRNFQQAVSQPINIPTPNMSGWNSAVQSAGQHVQQLNNQMHNVTPPPPPNMSGWHSTLQGVGQSMQQLGGRIQQTGQTMQNAFAPAAAASSLALGKMINDSREFEAQTRKAAILTNGSYNQVKSDILEMAKTSVYSTGQVAAAYAEMGAKGFDAAKATAALPGVLSAAAASGEDLGIVADTITSALNAFGMEASNSGHVADVLAQAANQSAASVLDMNYAFKYAAGPAHSLGISMEELAASVGIMVDAGSTGESAGTALRASMLRLVKPPKEAAKALEQLGVTTTDSNGKMKPLAQLMGELQHGMNGYTDAQKASTMASIFGTEAVSAMLNLMNAGPEKITKMTKALENSGGASKKAADAMLEGWAGAMSKMESALDVAGRAFTDALAPAIITVAGLIEKLANWFTNLSPKMQTVIATALASITAFLVLGTVFGIMANAIGTTIMVLGTFIGWLGKSAMVAKVASASMVALRAAFTFLTGPIGIAIMAMTALGIALVKLYKNNETFRNAVNQAWESIKSVTVSAIESMKSALDSLGAYLVSIPAKFSAMGNAISGAFGSVIEGLSAKFSGLGSVITPVINYIKSSFATIGNTIATLTPLIVRLGLSFLGVSGPVGWVIAIVASLGATIYKLVSTNDQAKAALSSAWESIKSVIGSVVSAILPIVTSLAKGFMDAFAPLAPELQKTGKVIAESFASLGPSFAELGKAFGELGSAIMGLFGEVIKQVMPLATDLMKLFSDTAIQLMPLISNAIQQVAQVFTEFTSKYLPMFVKAFQQGLPIVLKVIQVAFEIAGMLIKGFAEIITIVATTVLPLILQAVQAIFPVIVSIIQAAIPIVIQLIQLFAQVITAIATTVIPVLLQIVQAVFPIIVAIIQAAIPVVNALLQAAAAIIQNVLIPAIQFILQIVQIVFPTIMAIIQSAIGIITNIIKLFTAVLQGDWGAAWEAVKGITSSVMSLIGNIIQGAMSLIGAVVTGGLNLVRSIFSTVLNAIGSLVSSIFSGIRSVISSVISAVGSIISAGWNGVKSATSSILHEVSSTVSNIWNDIKSFLSGINLADIGKNIMKGLLNGISSMASSIWSKVTEIGDGIKDKLTGLLRIHSPSRVMRDIGVYIGQGLVNGMVSMVGAVQKVSERIADAATPNIQTLKQAELFQFKGDNPLTKYFNAIIEDGDYLNDWITHLPESIQDAVLEIGNQMEGFEGLTFADVQAIPPRRRMIAEDNSLVYEVGNKGNSENNSGTQNVNFERMFDGANFYVRNDNDIKEVARELHGLSEAAKRRRGIR